MPESSGVIMLDSLRSNSEKFILILRLRTQTAGKVDEKDAMTYRPDNDRNRMLKY
ncbi:hypothetical protein C7M51_03992 [Mixta intestinalis]|uniref:Uncharacterized protein n=1 Tax=Mixta intestinalis TaxID=1615494 RepID=A0A6P1Q6Q3_9GAMM|nr:hypothetical protein C7M51_03992 [Mixta intestinalis]